MIKRAAMAVAVGMILTCSGLGQDAHYDISVNGMGVLSKQTTGNQVVQTPTQGYGVVAVGEVRLNSRFAVQANAGHFDNSQKYATGTLDYRIQSTVTELSGALVCRLFQTEKWKPFLFGGAGVLFFNPDNTLVIEENPLSPGETAENIGAVRQSEIAALYGGGVDHPLLHHLSVRLQYRGLIYSAPSFSVPNLFTGQHGHIAEPSVGLVFSF
jgi:opacity protein-like surface antigen